MGGGGGRGGGAAIGGGGGFARGGGGAAIGGAGGYRGGGGGVAMGGGPRFSGAGAARVAQPNAFIGGPRVGGGAVAAGPRYATGGNWQGGGYRHYHRRGGGFWPGLAVGAAIGGSYAYYGSPGYYDQGYYDDSYYYDDSAVAAVPAEGGDEDYCRRTYRSWDPASGTYLGNDGQRHPCP
jgi:hypothetical protein